MFIHAHPPKKIKAQLTTQRLFITVDVPYPAVHAGSQLGTVSCYAPATPETQVGIFTCQPEKHGLLVLLSRLGGWEQS